MSEFVYRIKVLVKIPMSVVNDVEPSCTEPLNLTQSIEDPLEVLNRVCVQQICLVSNLEYTQIEINCTL